jgi:hypothetical protein
MQNAHLRMGTLQFTKITRDTTIDVRVNVDRAIAESRLRGSRRRLASRLPAVATAYDPFCVR